MEEDEFEEYTSAPPPGVSAEPYSAPPSSSEPFFLFNPSSAQPSQPALTPSYSLITTHPSQNSRDQTSKDQEVTIDPPLIKMESESVVPLEGFQLDFTKTSSHHSLPKPSLNNEFDFLLFDQQSPPIQDSANLHKSPPSAINFEKSNQGQLVQKEDVEYGLKTSDHSLPFEAKPVSNNNELLWDAEITQDKVENIDNNHAREEGKRKESEDFVFQSEEPERNTSQIPQKRSELVQFQQQQFNFEGTKDETKGYRPPDILQQTNENEEEKKDIQYQQFVEEKDQSDPEHQIITQPRKQSEDFVFQEAEHSHNVEESTSFPYTSKQQQKQSESYIPPSISNELQGSLKNNFASSSQTQQQFQQVNNINESEHIPNQQKGEEPKYKEVEQEDEEQEFGDFEETVEAVENKGQSYAVDEKGQTQVEMDGSRAPYDMNILTRERQLKDFVNSLPDYRFLLVQAFKTV